MLRVANASGFYGDRRSAAREMVQGGPIDVLTGDYLAELTMLILWRGRQKAPETGYARTFLTQAREILQPCVDRGIRIVVNAGGLNPSGLADAVRELAAELGIEVAVAHVAGDDLLPRLDDLRERGHGLAHLDTGAPLGDLKVPPITANAYLGGWGIVAALEGGADVVVTGRVTDASLVVGPGAWRFGWARDDWDQVAGAVVAGHAIECGAHVTGGNYAFFREVPGLDHVGFPIAELHADGSSTITKHPGTGGLVDVGTVTAQLLYEIGGPRYLNPDVVTRFDTVTLTEEGPDRVRIDGVRGEPPTPDLKVGVNTLGGLRNRATFVLTGLDIEQKAELVRRQLAGLIDLERLDRVDWHLVRSDHADAATNAEATATLTLTVQHHDAAAIDRERFAGACVELGLASYPGFTLTSPPADADVFGRYWPALVPADEVVEEVVHGDGRREQVDPVGVTFGEPLDGRTALDGIGLGDGYDPDGQPTTRAPLGTLVGARSGDKGGDANVGLWVRDPAHYGWLLHLVGDVDGVRRLLPEADDLEVSIHPLRNLLAVNVVVHGLLDEGVASAVRPDPQAKGLGEYVRSRMVSVPTAWLT
ncbi:acyclic terpene utilization AtuA family protein [Nitriliruptor alkaliphilus]|uniref:acyclic terpene utilization AtuA family protein n=1 Tax=Nitriliruptor alkaliphilus TaxID=427918 RepID=UPI001B80B2F3|nr:acyclic terpene utilization AtuA family protein [Nitriliruptor alkaliphilus]